MPSNKIVTIFIICIAIIASTWLLSRTPNEAALSSENATSTLSVSSYKNIGANTNDEWKKILVNIDQKRQPVTDLTKNNPNAFDDTSLTGQMARDYFSQYLLAKKGGQDLTPEATSEIVQNVLSNPDYTRTKAPVYIRSNLNISQNANPDTVKKYKDALTKNVTQKIAHLQESPVTAIKSATKSGNESASSKLDPLISTGKEIIQSLIEMEVPADVAIMHLYLLNSSSVVLSDLEALRVMLTDPVRSLTVAQQFANDMLEFQTSLNNINAYFKYKNVQE